MWRIASICSSLSWCFVSKSLYDPLLVVVLLELKQGQPKLFNQLALITIKHFVKPENADELGGGQKFDNVFNVHRQLVSDIGRYIVT